MKATLLVASLCLAAGAPYLAVGQGGAAPPRTPPATTGTAAISGVVIDGTTNAPLDAALVYLSMPGRSTVGAQSRQMTDAKGRFAFVDLPASLTYTISASKFGYLDGAYGRETALFGPSAAIAVRDGEWLPDLKVVLSWACGSAC
jgi:hypothetical protein